MEKMDLKRVIICSVCLPFMLIMVSPLALYLGNYQEYAINLKEVLILLIPLFCLFTFILMVLLLAAYHFPLLYKLLSGLLLGLAVFIWLQSQLLVWNFGLLDGKEIDWALWHTQVNIEWLLASLILILVILQAIKSQRILYIGAQGLLLIGLLTLIATWFTSHYRSQQTHKIPQKDLFSFHKTNNKIVIVLDTFQSDLFAEIAKRWPNEVDFLQGFSFYPNALSGYPTTKPSIPLILTGQFYKNEIPFTEWLEANNKTHNLADYYVDQGYGVSLVSAQPETLGGIKAKKTSLFDFDNTHWLGFNLQQLLVLDGGLFKALPTKWKPLIYNQGRWLCAQLATNDNELASTRNANDLQFLNLLEKKLKVDSEKRGEFKFYHYMGVHPPSLVNEYFKYEGNMPANPELSKTWKRNFSIFKKKIGTAKTS